MIARLVIDAIWRNRWAYVVVAPVLILCWLMYVASGSDVLEISMQALSLVFAAALGPMVAIATMSGRELRHLPVTDRDLWKTTWVVATVVTAGFLLATKATTVVLVLAFGGAPKVPAATILLSTVYDFSWAGAVLMVLPLVGYSVHAGSRRGTVGLSLTLAGTMTGLLACFVLPVLAGGALPTNIGEFTPTTIGALIGGLAVAFGGLAWTPKRDSLAGQQTRPQPAAAMRASSNRPRLSDRLTGISRVLVPHLLATLTVPVGLCFALAAYGIVTGTGPWWFVPSAPTVFDPEDSGDRGLTYFVLLPSLVAMQGLWTPWARLLRVLPFSVRQINALLLLTPFATWTVLWLLGVFGYALAYGTPATLRVAFVFGMAGVATLAHAILLRLYGSAATGWIIGAIGGLMPQLAKVGLSDSTVAQIVFAVIGVTAISVAAFVNHRTLTRSTSGSRAYRRPQQPFGLTAKRGLAG